MTNRSSKLAFTKMQGAGNDFIIIDNRVNALSKEDIVALAPDLCDRRFGIGADGVIALLPSKNSSPDFSMFYRNADGSDAGMCGNGARCLALYASNLGLGEQLSFDVHDIIYEATVEPSQNKVTVLFPMKVVVQKVAIENEPPLLKVQAGTEHIVFQVDEETLSDRDYLVSEGRKLREHPRFNPPGTNVNFICGDSKNSLALRTYERGVEDLTLACGTGAIASALAWHHIQKPSKAGDYTTNVKSEGGKLQIRYFFDPTNNIYKNIQLIGEAHFVFEGVYTY